MGEKSHSPQIQGAVFVGLIAALLRSCASRRRGQSADYEIRNTAFYKKVAFFCKFLQIFARKL